MTALVHTADLPDKAQALLDELNGYPVGNEDRTFQPSVLRYKVRKGEDVSGKTGYEGVGSSGGPMVSKVLAVTSVKTWYNDDDWVGGSKRLGTSEDLEPNPRKEEVQDVILAWCKKQNIREHVDTVLQELAPDSIKSEFATSGYGVKFDLYTNRVNPPWHQDWDDSCALFVGLMNLTRNSLGPTSIKGTEILDFTAEASSQSSAMAPLYNDASRLRKELMSCRLYETDGLGGLTEDQPFGQIRWFNDAVLVHRTPPYAVNTLSKEFGINQPYKLHKLNKRALVDKHVFEIPVTKLTARMQEPSTYDLDGDAPAAKRALLRITVRERRKHVS